MTKSMTVVLALAVGLTVGIALGGRLINSPMVAQTRTTGTPFSAVPGAIGAEDVSGPYGYVAEVDAAVSRSSVRARAPIRQL